MQVGDIVKHFLTEQIGIVLDVRKGTRVAPSTANVLWTTQGDSLHGPGHKEWCWQKSLDLLTTA